MLLEEALFPGEELSAPDPQHHDAGVVAVARVADDVAVAALDLEHDSRLFHLLEMVQHVPKLGGPLEIELLGGEIHPLADAPHDFIGPARQEQHHFVDHRSVVVLATAPECTAPCSA